MKIAVEGKQPFKDRTVTKRQYEHDDDINDSHDIDNSRKYITKGSKKFRINFICPKETSIKKIHALYFKQAITNNKNLEEKKIYLEVYEKELNNLREMDVFDSKIKLARNKVQKEKIIPINTILHANVTVFIKHVRFAGGIYKMKLVITKLKHQFLI